VREAKRHSSKKTVTERVSPLCFKGTPHGAEKTYNEQDLAEKADELARKLDDLQDTFVAKYEKRTVLLAKERDQLNVLDKEMYCLVKEATKRGINVPL